MVRRARVPALLCCLGALALGSDALADSATAPPIHSGPKVSVQAYGRQNPQCRAWANGCVLCTSDDDGHSQCSTPGIACEPHGITCKMMLKAK